MIHHPTVEMITKREGLARSRGVTVQEIGVAIEVQGRHVGSINDKGEYIIRARCWDEREPGGRRQYVNIPAWLFKQLQEDEWWVFGPSVRVQRIVKLKWRDKDKARVANNEEVEATCSLAVASKVARLIETPYGSMMGTRFDFFRKAPANLDIHDYYLGVWPVPTHPPVINTTP